MLFKSEAAFKRSAEIDALRINLNARDGQVILSGNVHSWAEREEGERGLGGAGSHAGGGPSHSRSISRPLEDVQPDVALSSPLCVPVFRLERLTRHAIRGLVFQSPSSSTRR